MFLSLQIVQKKIEAIIHILLRIYLAKRPFHPIIVSLIEQGRTQLTPKISIGTKATSTNINPTNGLCSPPTFHKGDIYWQGVHPFSAISPIEQPTLLKDLGLI